MSVREVWREPFSRVIREVARNGGKIMVLSVDSCNGLSPTKESKFSTISYNLEVMEGFWLKNKLLAKLLKVVEVSWVVEAEVAVVGVTGRWSPCLVWLRLME